MDQHSTLNLWVGNVISASAILTTLLGLVPAIAAIVALLWYLVQIYESNTIQTWLKNRRLRKLARLKARVIMLQAQLAQPVTPSVFDPPSLDKPQ